MTADLLREGLTTLIAEARDGHDIKFKAGVWVCECGAQGVPTDGLGSYTKHHDSVLAERLSEHFQIRGWYDPSDGCIYEYEPGEAAERDADYFVPAYVFSASVSSKKETQ